MGREEDSMTDLPRVDCLRGVAVLDDRQATWHVGHGNARTACKYYVIAGERSTPRRPAKVAHCDVPGLTNLAYPPHVQVDTDDEDEARKAFEIAEQWVRGVA